MADGICDPRRYPDEGSYPQFIIDVRHALLTLNRQKRPVDEVIDDELAPVLSRGAANKPVIVRT